MKLYYASNTGTGETKFYSSKKAAVSAARRNAKEAGGTSTVDCVSFRPNKSGILNLLNSLPVESMCGDIFDTGTN